MIAIIADRRADIACAADGADTQRIHNFGENGLISALEPQDALIHADQLRVHQPSGPDWSNLVGILTIKNSHETVTAVADVIFKDNISR